MEEIYQVTPSGQSQASCTAENKPAGLALTTFSRHSCRIRFSCTVVESGTLSDVRSLQSIIPQTTTPTIPTHYQYSSSNMVFTVLCFAQRFCELKLPGRGWQQRHCRDFFSQPASDLSHPEFTLRQRRRLQRPKGFRVCRDIPL